MFPRMLLCAVLAACSGFNIDERFPVIKEGQTNGSFFGFSVALHRQTKGASRYLLLAGAPKEKVHSLPNVKETGAVYSCPISTDPTDCTRMDLITSTARSEMVEGMWLGVTVASQRSLDEGRVLACGHRYVKIVTEQHRRMIGKCYVRSNDLTFDNIDEWQNDNYERCDPAYGYTSEGMCNLGISGAITETDVTLGATGSYSWTGNVHLTQRDPDPDKAWNFDNMNLESEKSKKTYSYIGFSVLQETKLLSQTSNTIVTGAPRDESKGSVMLGTKSGKKIEIKETILGEQVGSYFGSSLAAADLNNDGWNDLIIGAPFYFDRKENQGGAVYIFLNENGSFKSTRTMMLPGPSFSGFGTAVAAIGDVNQDGFQDFAVGAPFHEGGQVYIWMGSKKGISQEPSQVIHGQSVMKDFQSFGYSISAGMDTDGNSYPDILVGSLDDRIALLRARPVVHLTKNLTAEPRIVDTNQCPANTPCITVTVCLKFTLSNGNEDFKEKIVVRYSIQADAERRISRVRFSNNDEIFSGKLTLLSSKLLCEDLKLSVVEPVQDKLHPVVFSLNMSLREQKPNTGSLEIQNLNSFPILSQGQKLTQKTEINFQKECGSDNKCSSNLQMSAQFADDFNKPLPRRENINAQVLQFDKEIHKIRLLVSVTNFPAPGKLAEDAHQARLKVNVPNALSYSGFRSENTILECQFDNNNTVVCELGNPLKGKEKVNLQLVFETSRIDLYTKEIETQLILSTLSEQTDLQPVTVVMLIESTIEPFFSIKNMQRLTKFGGEVKGEYAMANTSDVGSLVEFTLNVDMNGIRLGDMGTLAVEFYWPHEVPNGKWLLYLTKIVVKGESEMECSPAGEIINPLNLSLSESRSQKTRSKRQTSEENMEETIQSPPIEPVPVTLRIPRKTYDLDCSKGTASCVTFTCPLHNMSDSTEIYVRARLWNSTMLEDYSNAHEVRITGSATLKLITDKSTIKMDPQPLPFEIRIEPEESVEIPYQLPLWIIITAAVAGIVLLGIIILILWKCGFFQRASRREMYEAKAQKAEMKIQPSETEKMIEDY